MGIPDEDFDSGDALFDDIDEDDLIFDALEEAGMMNPPKKHSRGKENDIQDIAPAKKARHGSLSLKESSSNGRLGETQRIQLARKLLADKFGYGEFRHEQEAAIARLLDGDNALVVFPTGAGKSLCYQIPAIAFPEVDRQTKARQANDSGITIVVSPLIALMKDQVDALKRRGIAAECMDSTKSWDEIQKINKDLREGQLRLLYCAPERLNNEGFVETMKRVKGGVRMIGVDEAHCISEWGHSFRPDYLKVARFVQEIKAERVICLTATATPPVVKDICQAFDISDKGVFRTSVYRPNLRLEAEAVKAKDDKYELLFNFLKTHPGSTLIYTTLQKQAEELAAHLTKQGVPAAHFHAGMKLDEKRLIQDDFMSSKIQTVVATIAFGMGIDKSDIRNIIHWDIPSTVEEYCQQVGRAGRDGKPSYCMLYLCREDFWIKENFARGDLPSRNSLRNLLKEIFDGDVVKLPPGETFKVSHYSQSSQFDIRMSPLSVIYAALELRFNLIRATTPEYSSYKFEAHGQYYPRLKSMNTPESKAILKHAKKAKKFYSIDPTKVANDEGLRRNEIINLLNDLNNSGAIVLTVGGVEQKYKVMDKLPKTDTAIDDLTDKLYEDLKRREKQALDRLKDVINFVTASKCFGLSIAQHFGMDLPENKKKCGHCTFCLRGAAVKLPPSSPKQVDRAAINKVLTSTDIRDDARFLARIAFGIKSPRVGKLKLDRSPAFMSMADHDFDAILKEFKKACHEKDE
ncbi:ATP-dependent DNA helicase Q-like 3 [Fusarium oxysporum f. sp. cubense race 1]|uniref:ATP-dependent DNA helicase n=1 Tax=Fusarium oxysporum f. sp. cubense (strain race 1) TaxID=1229664 RepID=N4U541_FUSC1|nr:ATP-dependent DNA helicase Q-like 3 [Fusarium oxysporum f. sp. cubense race 1]